MEPVASNRRRPILRLDFSCPPGVHQIVTVRLEVRIRARQPIRSACRDFQWERLKPDLTALPPVIISVECDSIKQFPLSSNDNRRHRSTNGSTYALSMRIEREVVEECGNGVGSRSPHEISHRG